MSHKAIVLDPRGKEEPRESQVSRRLSTLEGARLGFLDNLKPNSDMVIDQVVKRLSERFHLGPTAKRAKAKPTAAAASDIYDELQESDLVVLTLGDCGGCAAWTIEDAVQLERRGVPTVTFVTSAFVAMADALAKARGIAALPIVRLPHPFSQLSADDVRREVDAVIDRLVEFALSRDIGTAAEHAARAKSKARAAA